MKTTAASVLILIFLTSGCISRQNPRREFQITETDWKLTELNSSPVLFDKKEAYMILKTEDSRAAGFTGCNMFKGTYSLEEGNRIRFSKIASTMMMCVNMETETQFIKVLETADSYLISDNVLILYNTETEPLAKFESASLK